MHTLQRSCPLSRTRLSDTTDHLDDQSRSTTSSVDLDVEPLQKRIVASATARQKTELWLGERQRWLAGFRGSQNRWLPTPDRRTEKQSRDGSIQARGGGSTTVQLNVDLSQQILLSEAEGMLDR